MQNTKFERLKKHAKEYSEQYDVAYVINYIKMNCQEDKIKILKQADQLLKQVFVFEGKWDMEPCSTPYELKNMVWDISPNDDLEWVYMLNRHEYLSTLLMAYYLTNNLIYVEKLKWYLQHWICNNPIVLEGTVTTRTIDTGIRCMNWQFLLIQMLGMNLLDQKETEMILKSMKQQFHYMRIRYIDKYSLSNWGILQTTSICQGYLWFKEYLLEAGMEKWAWKELKYQIDLQILPDGAHWEQSIMYHIEVLLAFMKLFSNDQEQEWLLDTIDVMSRYVLHSTAPDHCQIAQCDSDVTDVRDVLVKAAVFTGDGRYKYGGFNKMDIDSAWLLGRKNICRYHELTAVKPESQSLNVVDTGNIYFRSGWDENSHFTYLRCGPLGSSHGHADQTHVSLHYKGKPFLIDSGRYSYQEDPLRTLLKSAQAHNICVVDGETPGRPISSWEYDSFGQCMKNYYREEGPVRYGEMACYGNLSDGSHCLIMRKVMAVDSGIWLIVNDICCTGVHTVEEYYHMDSAVEVSLLDPDGDRKRWGLKNGAARMNLWGSGTFDRHQCVVSNRYNQLSESECLVKESSFINRHTDWTCFGEDSVCLKDAEVYQISNPLPMNDNMVTAKEFRLSEQESWTLLVWNRETYSGGKLYKCHDIGIYAKAAAIHIEEGKRTLYRLRI